jgi:holliday junction DNA helicase RuvA
MIGFLRGRLFDKKPTQVLVDVNGVGYQVQVPLSTYALLGAIHSETELLIHTHVREDQITLYGFQTAREKQSFELLISASGVGPNLGIRILSGMSPGELLPAIRKGDLAQLTRIPGVGRKIAERMVVELRDKIALIEPDVQTPSQGRPPTEEDVISALLNLGYERRTAEQVVERGRAAGSDFDTLLRAALKQLGGTSSGSEGRGGRR